MEEERIDFQQAVYFKESEIKIIEKIAKEEERSISNWIRKVVLEKMVKFETGEELKKKDKNDK